MTQGERITALEVEVTHLKEAVLGMDKKLDDLFDFRHKGLGAIRVVAFLFSAGVIGFITNITSFWHKG